MRCGCMSMIKTRGHLDRGKHGALQFEKEPFALENSLCHH